MIQCETNKATAQQQPQGTNAQNAPNADDTPHAGATGSQEEPIDAEINE